MNESKMYSFLILITISISAGHTWLPTLSYKDVGYTPHHHSPVMVQKEQPFSTVTPLMLPYDLTTKSPDTDHYWATNLNSHSMSDLNAYKQIEEVPKSTLYTKPDEYKVCQHCYHDYANDMREPPISRMGNMGASWRHVRHCYDNQGAFITFLDGTVKIDDCNRYPPTGLLHTPSDLEKIHQAFKSSRAPMRIDRVPKIQSKSISDFKSHLDDVRHGKVYKCEYEPKKMSSPVTIQGRVMKNAKQY